MICSRFYLYRVRFPVSRAQCVDCRVSFVYHLRERAWISFLVYLSRCRSRGSLATPDNDGRRIASTETIARLSYLIAFKELCLRAELDHEW